MLTKLLQPRANRRLIADLHRGLVAAARRPTLFLPPYSVSDTLEGRFDLLVLLAVLLLRRLEKLPPPGPEIAQEIVNTMFDHLDADLREMGVGDLAVPKRMKKLAGIFGGRSAAYREALDRDGAAFTAVIARNVYGSDNVDERSAALATYCNKAVADLERTDLAGILAGSLFPDPE
ncbi:MAG: ubiquinol-cytochrome C chaperone [Methylobacteriaceae bacterium]|nr:ubiquinol-cytochrome C chaperone [Methylobacteriaceae bacterium]